MDLLLSKCPPNSPGKCTGGQRCPETACATMSSALQAVMVQPKVREGAVPQVRRAPRGTGVPDSSANLGRCSSFHRAPPAAGDSGETWSQAKQRTGLGCAMELLPPIPDHHPAQSKGGAAEPLHLHCTPNIPKKQCHSNPC